MSTENKTKINKLLTTTPKGVVLLSSWFSKEGYSYDLLKRYKHTQWLTSIGRGALIRTDDNVEYYGGLYALQKQAKLNIHIGGRTAISLQGMAHYLELSTTKAILFGSKGVRLPPWFSKYDWHIQIDYYSTVILPPDLGLIDIKIKEFSVKISGAARAMMECLYLAPKNQELSECYELMESMNNLRPTLIQELLEKCSSVKVKRLFLCLAERVGHEWFHCLDLQKIDLGKGTRSLVKNGLYDDKYKIIIPKNWNLNGM